MENLKISVIEPIGGHGGNEFYDFGLCESVALNGCDVTFYTCNETVLDYEFKPQCVVKKVYKNIYGKENKLIRGFRYVISTINALIDAKSNKTKIAHFHIYHFSGLEYFNLVLFSIFGFKLVITIHDIEPFDKYGKNININYNKYANIVNHIVVHNQYSLKCLRRVFTNLNAKKVSVVPSGDLDFIYKIEISQFEARKKLSLPESAKIILFFGQIKKVKGLDVLLKAFNEIVQKHSDTYLLIAGKTWKVSFQEYQNYISENKLDSKIILHINYIPNEDVPYYFKASDITVLPYKKIYNSSVILRAFDYSTTVIASDLDTFKEFVKDEENGLLFKSEDYIELAEKISYLLNRPHLINIYKKNARDFVKKYTSREKINKKMIAIYKGIVDSIC